VWISDDEIAALARHLEMDEEAFRRSHTRGFGGGGVVLLQKQNQDCVFWEGRSGCRVYAQRPRQCRTYPFWAGNLHGPGSWQQESASCPGIGAGPLYPAEEIARSAADDGIPEHRTRLRSGDDG
jgi:Fe-S-cluster containining protein